MKERIKQPKSTNQEQLKKEASTFAANHESAVNSPAHNFENVTIQKKNNTAVIQCHWMDDDFKEHEGDPPPGWLMANDNVHGEYYYEPPQPMELQVNEQFKDSVKKVGIQSSKARFARRHQSVFKSGRNIGTMKLVKDDGNQREVVYINSESLGMGNKSFTNPNEQQRTKAKTKKRRKHSEPGLLFAQQHDHLKSNDGGEEIKVSDFKVGWVYSSNQPCGKGGENCEKEIVPKLDSQEGFYFSNPYEGSKESGGFEKLVNGHKMRLRTEEDYDSEEYSEDESNITGVYMIDPSSLSNRGEDDQTPLTIFDFKKELEDEETKEKNNVKGHYHGHPLGKKTKKQKNKKHK